MATQPHPHPHNLQGTDTKANLGLSPTEGLLVPDIQAQIARVEERLELLRAQVRQAQQLAGLGMATAMIAHEVSNLLTPILAYAQSALQADDLDLQRRALSVTVKNTRMLVAMAERVLTITAAKPATRGSVSVRTVALDAVQCLCRDLAKDGIELALHVDEAVSVRADELQLRQVLFNLFLNARSAMAQSHNGRLSVDARRNGKEVVIRVTDNGKGIPEDALPYVFDPLKTSKPTDSNGLQRCAGLGLALCRDLVEENGGTISVTSEPGRGTTFAITFPIE